MKYLQEISLKVSEIKKFKYIQAKQSDNRSRFIKVTIIDEENKQLIPSEGDTAVFRALKPDKKCVINPAVINSDGTITVELTAQVLAVKGQVEADVSIIHEDQVLSTVSFFVIVDRVPTSKDQTESSNEFLYLIEISKKAEESANLAKQSADIAVDAANRVEEIRSNAQTALEVANKSNQIAQSVRDDADSGKFNGKPGPPGKKGDSGDVYIPLFKVIKNRLIMLSNPGKDKIMFTRRKSRLFYKFTEGGNVI